MEINKEKMKKVNEALITLVKLSGQEEEFKDELSIFNDIVESDGEITDEIKNKIAKVIKDKDNDTEYKPFTEDEFKIDEFELTPQEIVEQFHKVEYNIKLLSDASFGLTHIQDKYMEVLELEREEARKALGKENKEYFKYL